MAALGWLAIVAFVVVGLYYADRLIDPHAYEDEPEDELEKERREWM